MIILKALTAILLSWWKEKRVEKSGRHTQYALNAMVQRIISILGTKATIIVLAVTDAHSNPHPLKAAFQDGTTGTTVL